MRAGPRARESTCAGPKTQRTATTQRHHSFERLNANRKLVAPAEIFTRRALARNSAGPASRASVDKAARIFASVADLHRSAWADRDRLQLDAQQMGELADDPAAEQQHAHHEDDALD